MPKKPTGHQGYYRVTVNVDGTANSQFHREHLGDQKEGVEQAIVSKFVTAWAAMGVNVEALPNRQENDLDFTIITAGGKAKLELTELVFPAPKGQSPYRAGKPFGSTYGEASDQLLSTISHKAQRYTKGSMPIDLLVYATHEIFEPVEGVIRLTQYRLAKQPFSIPFENIFLLQDPPTGPVVRCLYPVPPQVTDGLDPIAEEAKEYVRLAPDGWELVTSPPTPASQP